MKQLKRGVPIAAALLVWAAATVSATDIYVDAERGSANGNGSSSAPYQTVEQARDAVRKINSDMKEDINVYLRGGIYYIEDPIRLTTVDSGSNGYYVNYRAYPGESPEINGAKEITGWTLYDSEKGIYRAPANGIKTRHLYVDGKRAVRAKTEKKLTNLRKTETGFLCDDEWLLDIQKPSDLEFSWVVLWTNPRCGVQSVEKNADGRIAITMKNPGWHYFQTYRATGQVAVAEPTWIENAYEFLDEEGEFYLDTDQDFFYYMPRAGEDLSKACVYAPVAEQMLQIEGDSYEKKVHHIRIDGLRFLYTTWNRPSTGAGHHDTQCNYLVDSEGEHRMIDAAITLRCAEHVPIENCVIGNIGNIGIKLEKGTQYSDVTGNHLYSLSGTGIALGEVTGNTISSNQPKYFCRGNNVRNNLVEDVGIDFHSSVGISAGHPMECEISHNEIIGSNYSGMHLGYGWGNYVLTGTNIHDFEVTDNIVAETMKSCQDGGGIYTLGATGGTTERMNLISGNYIYDCVTPNAILYADEGSCYWTFQNNVIDNYGNTHGSWFMAWRDSIHDVNVFNNHTTQTSVTNHGSNCLVEGTEYAQTLNWSDEALAIIANAGLEPEYKEKLGGFDKNELGRLVSELPDNMKKGESTPLLYQIRSKGGVQVSPSECNIEVTSSDSSIIAADKNSLTAVGAGSCTITIAAERNGSVVKMEKTIISDDVLVDVELNPVSRYVALGNAKTMSALGTTRFGQSVTEGMTVSYQSLQPETARISSDGVITALEVGKFTVRVTAEYDGTTISKDFEFESLRPGDSRELDSYPKYKLIEETKSTNGWYAERGTAKEDNGGIELSGTFVTYKERKFQNELLEFNLKLNGEISWPTIVFNNSSYDICALDPNTSSYIIVIQGEREIELQRWINGVGTMIYGEVPGRVTIEKERIKNNCLRAGETAYIQVGTFDEVDGVRIIFWVNGEKVIDYLDRSDEALRGGGYFGILEQTAGKSMRLSPPEVVVREAAAVSDGFDDLDGHWSKQAVMDLYDLGLVKGVGDNQFAPDAKITRAEFLAMAERAALLPETSSQEAVFEDNAPGAWYYQVLNTALEQGLLDIHMIQNDRIEPNRAITREEMASIAARICALKNKNSTAETEEYQDWDQISPWAVEAMRTACANGIFRGDENGCLNPQQTATRAEAVSVIKGIYALNE